MEPYELQEIAESLQQRKAELAEIPFENWAEFRDAFRAYQKLRDQYILAGGCML